jgi:ABC-type polysaccharide/polyol phosphate transport system ATPase subunit
MAELTFDNVTIEYPIFSAGSMSLRNKLVSIGTGGMIKKDGKGVTSVCALDNVSFSLGDGESVGLTGHNGAGKTTLLRAMAGIYAPTKGKVTRVGRTSTIIEIGAGMDEELSGYENILRMALLLSDIDLDLEELTASVTDFTELGDFLNLPVHTYSAGMKMRLMFAVATSISPEILLVDEMFGAGDQAFQDKAFRRMEELIGKAKIFVFASHSSELLDRFCRRKLQLSHGKIKEL